MAGKRQHFVPQFLQRGFSSRQDGDTFLTYVYRKNSEPFETSTRHVGVGNHFYSKPENTFIDDIITDAETEKYSALVNRLKSTSAVNSSEQLSIAQLVSHFEIRSRNLRESFRSVGTVFIDSFVDNFSQKDILRTFMAELILKEPERVLGKKEMMQLKVPQNIKFQLLNVLRKNIISGALDSKIAEIAQELESRRGELREIVTAASEQGHLQAMAKSIEPEDKVSRFQALNYEIIELESLPLGDSMVLFYVEASGQNVYKTFLSSSDKLLAAMLPLSPSKLLIGGRANYIPNSIQLRQAIVECSVEFYLASKHDDQYSSLLPAIGANSNLVSKREMHHILNELDVFS